MTTSVRQEPEPAPKIHVRDFNFFYGDLHVLHDIGMDIPEKQVTALIGPSGCGKSTFLRSINRMNDIIPGARAEGLIAIGGKNVYAPGVNVVALRRRVGMVFQKSNPFSKSIYENIAYGLRIGGIKDRRILDETVERSLQRAALWDEVKDRLNASALALSGGQQQRLRSEEHTSELQSQSNLVCRLLLEKKKKKIKTKIIKNKDKIHKQQRV